jgi:hypothetical protein
VGRRDGRDRPERINRGPHHGGFSEGSNTVGITQIKGWLKGIAVGAAFAALVAVPLAVPGPAAAKVQMQDFHFAKVTFTDILVSSKVSQQDFHFVMHAPAAPAVETALNFTKIEYKNSALNFTKIEF